MKFVFFGTDDFSVAVLRELKANRLIPSMIVTVPDRPRGRHLIPTPPPVNLWAIENKIPFIQPDKPDEDNMRFSFLPDFFVVASYGRILPNAVLKMPRCGALNIHPSLLPKYRGASPVRTAILNDDKDTGVTIMLMDGRVDTGPILAQRKYRVKEWRSAPVVETELARAGARLLSQILPAYLGGDLKPMPQDEDAATYTKKLKREDAEIDINGSPRVNFLKIQAYACGTDAFFFATKQGRKVRVKIAEAEFRGGSLKITRVVPDGRKEMDYEEFLRGCA